jgi:TatD DNase family protein
MSRKHKEPAIPVTDLPLVDTHCHLDMDAYANDLETVLQNAISHNIAAIISIGIDLASSAKAVELAKRHRMIAASVGIHPHDIDNITSATLSALADIVEQNREYIVGYGEIGLDYAKKYSLPENQRRQFRNQLDLANCLHLPVIIHDREAHEDVLAILKASGPLNYGGVLHCFSGDLDFARTCIDLGLHISIPGTVTYKNADTVREVAKNVPLTSLLLETDGPFLAPHPNRGKRNEPAFVLSTAQAVAELRGIALEDLAKQTSLNAKTLFGLHHLTL